MSELWLIGEAPTQANGPAFTGRAAQRLSEWLERDLHETFHCANVLPAWPGKSESGKGAKFPRGLAQQGVENLHSRFHASDWIIVVGGRNANNAWRLRGLDSPYMWGAYGEVCARRVPNRLQRLKICWIPHPSPVNQRWNDPNTIQELKEFIDVSLREREEAGLGDDAS